MKIRARIVAKLNVVFLQQRMRRVGAAGQHGTPTLLLAAAAEIR
jgi:hypothetical protein